MRTSVIRTGLLIGIFSSVPLFSGAQGEIPYEAVTVCILDSGCNLPRAEGKNYLNENKELKDDNGHGTVVYEILTGEAPEAEVYMLKCFEYDEVFSDDEDAVIRAIYDAVDVYDADIIQMSWTLNEESESLYQAVQYAADNGTVLTATTGNLSLSTPLGSKVYPASWEEVIGVTGAELNEHGEITSSLWYLHSEAVFVSANGMYQNEKGSSFAVPRVSGVLAEYFRNIPKEKRRKEHAEEYLKKIAEDAGKPGYDTTFGWGYIRSFF